MSPAVVDSVRMGTSLQQLTSAKQGRIKMENHISDSVLNVGRSFSLTGYANGKSPISKVALEFFYKEPTKYTHTMYKNAASMFDSLKHVEKEDNPFLRRHREQLARVQSSKTETKVTVPHKDKRLVCELVYDTLKYQKILDTMLEDSAFFSRYPELKQDRSLITVMLYDFKTRSFQTRNPLPHEHTSHECSEVEHAILTYKTKFAAILARNRIKARILDIEEFLPKNVRQNDEYASTQQVFCWVNAFKSSINQAVQQLLAEGFAEVQQTPDLQGFHFYRDHQCKDLLAFPAELRTELEKHPLIELGHMLIQDRSSSLGPHSIKNLINDGDDVIHVNVGSGMSTAHLASILSPSESVIYGFGNFTARQHVEVQSRLEKLGCGAKIHLFDDNFLDMDIQDERIKNVKVILVTADCSRSAVVNPVDFIVSEGEDMSILKDLSIGTRDDSKIGELMAKHNAALRHALKFPRVQAVVYATRSLYEAENEAVVSRSIEYINGMFQKKRPFKLSPPVVPLSEDDIESGQSLVGKFLKSKASYNGSGYFLATITREAEDPKEAAKDILARAAARGLLSNSTSNSTVEKKNSGVKGGKVKGKSKKQDKKDTEKLDGVAELESTSSGNLKGKRRGSKKLSQVSTLRSNSLSTSPGYSTLRSVKTRKSKSQRRKPDVTTSDTATGKTILKTKEEDVEAHREIGPSTALHEMQLANKAPLVAPNNTPMPYSRESTKMSSTSYKSGYEEHTEEDELEQTPNSLNRTVSQPVFTDMEATSNNTLDPILKTKKSKKRLEKKKTRFNIRQSSVCNLETNQEAYEENL